MLEPQQENKKIPQLEPSEFVTKWDWKKMNFLNIKKEKDLCWVYLNRPDAMNALNNELLRELTEFNNNLKNDLDTKVVIYSEAGENFSSWS